MTPFTSHDNRCKFCGLSGMYTKSGQLSGLPKKFYAVAMDDTTLHVGHLGDVAEPVQQIPVHNACVIGYLEEHPYHALLVGDR